MIIRYQTTYIANDKIYPSEIYIPDGQPLQPILDQRQLPNESIHNVMADAPEDPVTVSTLIDSGKYLDAVHRIMYLVTIAGESFDFLSLINDNGLLHKLIEHKTNFKSHDLNIMKTEANDLEASIPGTWLHASIQ